MGLGGYEMKRKIHEWLSIRMARKPGSIILISIFAFNIIFFLISSIIISKLSLAGTESMGFLQAAFCTITMILDPGCIQFVIDDIGHAGVVISIVCVIIIITGMISFTGAVIGYITNYISDFVVKANDGSRKLKISGHVVILNWNTRASEIINDFLYCKDKKNVVILADSRRHEIMKEIVERIEDTINRENSKLHYQVRNYGFIKKHIEYQKNKLRKNVRFIVREGDVYSSKQLHDISIEYADIVIILGNDLHNTICKYENVEKDEKVGKGNSHTIKTLMQVSDLTASEYSRDGQKIIVEITDEWTKELVDKIIKNKQVDGKCNIVPVCINQILGQILSQFSLMPELNLAYSELFSNKGVTFYTKDTDKDEKEFVKSHLAGNKHSIPLTTMEYNGHYVEYYSAVCKKDIEKHSVTIDENYTVSLNHNYWIEKKTVIILGHNSMCRYIMKGFESFRGEWNYKDGKDEILSIIVIDDKKNLERMNYYKEYPFVTETVEASIYDKDIICNTIERVVDNNIEDTSVLILSDESTTSDSVDANALANLVYVQDIINHKIESDPDFDPESIDVIVEIINPKHHDIVNSYSVNNVVISNRYISKMITQVGEKEELYNLYTDILTYDEEDSEIYESKEIYAKKVSSFFAELPKKCTSDKFIRAVYEASIDKSLPDDKQNPTIVLGYVKPGGLLVLFGGDQTRIEVEIEKKDKLIVFSNH